MANEGHIIVKGKSGRYSTRQFFKDIDKGSSKPAFCYPRRAQALQEDLDSMNKNLKAGMVSPDRKMIYERKRDELANKVSEIRGSFESAKELIAKNKDGWKSRRDNLADEIKEATPTRHDVRNRAVNPHTILRQEKQGLKGEQPLERKKRDFTIISRAFQAAGEYEEANHSFLQKDK